MKIKMEGNTNRLRLCTAVLVHSMITASGADEYTADEFPRMAMLENNSEAQQFERPQFAAISSHAPEKIALQWW